MGDLSRVQNSIPVQLVDANDLQVVDISTNAPSGTEAGIIVRPIVSGTQTVSGTVIATPSGTYTVSGTITATPSGTQVVSGTVTANPTGTYTVTGSTTANPTGTYTMTGSGSAGTASAGVVTVQGITNGVAITTDLADASFKSKGLNTITAISPNATATLIATSNSNRIALLIFNAGGNVVYLGKTSSVTTADGMPLYPLSSLEDTESKDSWYGVTSTGTGDIRVVETAI